MFFQALLTRLYIQNDCLSLDNSDLILKVRFQLTLFLIMFYAAVKKNSCFRILTLFANPFKRRIRENILY